jgi:hypothetical protein
MLFKLQKRTLVVSQIIGNALTIFVGVTIILVTSQFYFDIKPLMSQQSDIFKSKSAVISKNISVFKTIDKEKIYFTNEEIIELENQSFTKNISKFKSATFKINAYSKKTESVPVFYTDLFFESIPDTYLDVKTDEWKWKTSLDFIPIIIPENYLNLYNFGFAESQGLPVLSKNTISQIEFNIQISGNHKSKDYKSKIVGFSNKVNSILVPEEFLSWANKEFGRLNKNKTSRVLIEFNNPSDKAILEYFNENNYSINKDKLQFSKLVFFFKSALIFVFFIAFVIIVLSVSFILLSLNLIIQRNKELLVNLYNIGYNYNRIAKFYQVSISLITMASITASIIISNFIRNYYLAKIINLFDFTVNKNYILLFGISLILILILVYNVLLIKNIKKIVIPRNEK